MKEKAITNFIHDNIHMILTGVSIGCTWLGVGLAAHGAIKATNEINEKHYTDTKDKVLVYAKYLALPTGIAILGTVSCIANVSIKPEQAVATATTGLYAKEKAQRALEEKKKEEHVDAAEVTEVKTDEDTSANNTRYAWYDPYVNMAYSASETEIDLALSNMAKDVYSVNDNSFIHDVTYSAYLEHLETVTGTKLDIPHLANTIGWHSDDCETYVSGHYDWKTDSSGKPLRILKLTNAPIQIEETPF